MEKYVPDTSALIANKVTELVREGRVRGKVVIPRAVIAELEHQANIGQKKGDIGLNEIEKLQEFAKEDKIEMGFKGDRPKGYDIKHAESGEIDAMIRRLAWNIGATLISGDRVQMMSAKAYGMNVIFIEPEEVKETGLENFFDEKTMSIHLKEGTKPVAKVGEPGDWQFVKRGEKLTQKDIEELAEKIVERATSQPGSFIETSRKGSKIIQLGNYRIVVTQPPLSEAWELTAVRPIKKLSLSDYDLSGKLMRRLDERAAGILIAGSPGAGKTTFAQALAEHYKEKKKLIKTVEAPRDLQLSPAVTQYSKDVGKMEELHDILLLSRPDYTFFDEVRYTADFKLYSDLRLAGVGMVGVIHATDSVDAIKRFLDRVELGLIPSILDTVVFIKGGEVHKVLALSMEVKVPAGMGQEDLARPVIVVRDFETEVPEYEIYSYGEETVVVPVRGSKGISSPTQELAKESIKMKIKRELHPGVRCEVEFEGEDKAILYLPEKNIPRIIGKGGKRIREIEKSLGINIDVRELEEGKKGEEIDFRLTKDEESIMISTGEKGAGERLSIYTDGGYLTTVTASRKGVVRIKRNSRIGKALEDASKIKVEI